MVYVFVCNFVLYQRLMVWRTYIENLKRKLLHTRSLANTQAGTMKMERTKNPRKMEWKAHKGINILLPLSLCLCLSLVCSLVRFVLEMLSLGQVFHTYDT